MTFYDMHTHSKFSHDSKTELEDLVDSQIKRGAKGFAVTDHCDIKSFEERNIYENIVNSIKAVKAINEKCKIKVLRGVEIGDGFWFPEKTESILKINDFDVVIGSVHSVEFVNLETSYSEIDFSKLKKDTIIAYMDKYFDDVYTMLNSFDYDVMAHLTCPLRYITGKYRIKIDIDIYNKKIEKILEFIIKNNIALEVNTSNLGTEFDSLMPNEKIIKRYKEMGGYLITLGSDAHVAKNAAKGFEKAVEVLKKSGYSSLYYYENRKVQKYDI